MRSFSMASKSFFCAPVGILTGSYSAERGGGAEGDRLMGKGAASAPTAETGASRNPAKLPDKESGASVIGHGLRNDEAKQRR